MPLQPSRRDTIGPPPRDVSDLAARVRHQGSYLRSLDPGIQEGRFRTLTPVQKGPPRQLVGGDAAGDDTDYAWEYDDRHIITVAGTQTPRLSHIPIDETLHVFWHPGGDGDRRLTSEYFTVDDQIVTIPDPGYFTIGDTFSFQYEYEVSDDVADLEFIASVRGVFSFPENTLTFTLPAETQPGDFLILACRGAGAPGGGEVTLDITSTDPRISRIYTATHPIIESVFTGFATGSRADIVTNVTVTGGTHLLVQPGIMGVFRGVNAVAGISAVEAGSVTPQVSGTAAVAVTWVGDFPFAFQDANPPSGYTDAGDTGLDYTATDISYWSDPAADTSIAGTFAGEGCLVIGLT